jgi:hypothetical protein
MAMGTDNTAPLTRASRKLKELASDTISIPTAQELYDRAVDRLHDARRKLLDIEARQRAIESGKSRSSGDTAGILAEKKAATARIERLEAESTLLYLPVQPVQQLSPEAAWRRDFWRGPAPAPADEKRNAALVQASKELDALVVKAREARFNGSKAAESALMPELNRARLRVAVLEGRHPRETYMPAASIEDWQAMRKELGL